LTLHRDREDVFLCLRVDPHDSALTHELNGPAKLVVLHGYSEADGSMLRNQRRGLQEESADTDIPAYGLELNHQVSRVSLEVNRVLQAEAAIFPLLRKLRLCNVINFFHGVRLLSRSAPMLNAVTPGSKEHERTLPEKPSLEVGLASLFLGNSK